MILAALDVGTNTVLMLVVEYGAGGGLRILDDMARITRMGKGVDRNHALDPEATQGTLDAIVEFSARARRLGATKILTAATSALRDARDGAEFIATVKSRAGVDLDIISGGAEAQLSYLAVAHGLKLDPQEKILIVDIGGGSTELIAVEPGRPLAMASLQVGSVRMTERFVKHDPPAAEAAAALQAAIDAELARLGWTFRPGRVVGIAGTVTTICAVSMKLATYDHNLVHGHELSVQQVRDTLQLFGSLPAAERRKLPGLLEGRVDVIFAGATILERVMHYFGAECVLVSDRGVRWGLVYRELERAGAVS